jgi:hypothetical protein
MQCSALYRPGYLLSVCMYYVIPCPLQTGGKCAEESKHLSRMGSYKTPCIASTTHTVFLLGIWRNNTKWGYLSRAHGSTDDNGRGKAEQQARRMLLTGVKAEGRPSTRNIRTRLHLEYEHHGTARSIRGVLCIWEMRESFLLRLISGSPCDIVWS